MQKKDSPMLKRFSRLLPMAACMVLAACAATGAGSRHDAEAAVAAPGSLQAYHWQIEGAISATGQYSSAPWHPVPQGQRPVQLTFSADDRVSVQHVCNLLSAAYQLEGGRIGIGPGMSTRRACSDQRLVQLEQLVAAQLPQARTWRIEPGQTDGAGPRLRLGFEDGSQWILAGRPTDATRYGSAPERVFLEVAPEQVACSHPLIPNARCLNVRTVNYDERGLQTGTGPWQVFHGEIEGFEFEPGIRSVLRINRYTRKNPPADASRHVYVLDMRVLSERVR